jgi:hypothetical protein
MKRDERDDDRAGLRLPVGVNNSTLLVSNVLPVPVPRLRVDRLSDGSDSTERGKVVSLDVLLAEATEKTNGGRGGVELEVGKG